MTVKKYCAQCNAVFNCNAVNIQQCFCFAVKLSKTQTDFLNQNFTGCLCLSCLNKSKLNLNTGTSHFGLNGQ
jgi:hypothetical protein